MQNFGFDLQEYKEKREIRRAANCIGAAYALMFAVAFVLELVLILVALFMGGDMQKALSIFEDGVFSWALQAVLSAVMFTLPYILAVKLCGRRLSSVIECKKPKKAMFWPLTMLGVGVCQVGEIMTNLFASVSESVGISPAMPDMEYDTSIFGIALGFLATAVVPAFVEEFALRGVTMGLLRRFGDGFYIIVSATLFGLMHGNLIQAPFAFVVGLGLGFIMIKSGSIWTAVTVHFINNALAVVFEYVTMGLSDSLTSVLYYTYAILMLVVGVIGFIISSKRDSSLWTIEKSETALSERKKITTVFTAPFIIVALVITVIEMIIVQVMY